LLEFPITHGFPVYVDMLSCSLPLPNDKPEKYVAFSRPLLELLSDGHFYSGNQLGERLGCSRAAVWKMIQVLETAGVDIFHVRGKGYRLAQAVELLSAERILDAMSESGRQSLSGLDVLFDVDSTNTYLIERPLGAMESGRACFAEFQRLGRGRRGRQWVSPFGGNLYLSLRWRFSRGAAELSGLSLAVGVALLRTLREEGVEGLGLKWPNDILLHGRKLAGVLLEISGEANGPCEVVIGLGLNIRTTEFAQDAIDQPWSDLESSLGRRIARNALAAQVLTHLIEAARQYDVDGLDTFRDVWVAADAFSGREVVLQTPSAEISGIAQGVDENGALILALKNGGRQHFYSGEISLRATSDRLANA